MPPKRPIELFYRPRLWPTFMIATVVALGLRFLAARLGREIEFLAVAMAAFCVGMLLLAFLQRRKVGIIPLAVPSPDTRVLIARLSMGLIWGGIMLLSFLLLLYGR